VTAALLACARGGTALAEDPAAGARGSDERPRVVRERDGWTEILTEEGTRALVPTRDMPPPAPASVATPRRAEKPATAPRQAARPAPVVAEPPPDGVAGDGPEPRRTAAAPAAPAPDPAAARALAAEVTRLGAVVDDLAALAPAPVPERPARPWLAPESLLAIGAAALLGFVAGIAVQRQRARRARSLRF